MRARLLLSMLLSCRSVGSTEVLVELTAEPRSQAMARSVRVIVTAADGELRYQHTAQLQGSQPVELPTTIPIVPLGGDSTRTFRFTAELLGDAVAGANEGRVFNVYRGVGAFVEHEQLRTRVMFSDACTNIFCPLEQTCDSGECVSIGNLPSEDEPQTQRTCVDALGHPPSPFERSLIDLAADSWLEVPNSPLVDVCAESTGIRANSGCRALFYLSGGAYDPVHHDFLFTGGRGSGRDYWGNELYAFNMERGRWEMRTEPSRPPAGATNNEAFEFFQPDRLADGNPTSRNTFDGIEYLLHLGQLYMKSNAGTMGWFFDPRSGSWSADDLPHDNTNTPASAYDPVNRSFYLRSGLALQRFDPDTRMWTTVATAPSNSGLRPTGALDTKRRLLWFAQPSSARQWEVWDLTREARVDDEWILDGGDEALYDTQGPGLDYDSRADVMVAWAGGAPWLLEIEAKRWRRGNLVGAPSESAVGTYGRFRYLRDYNVFALMPSTQGNVFFYKSTAGCGP